MKNKQEKPTYAKTWAFQLSGKIFFVLSFCPKDPVFNQFGPKVCTPKHYKNRGFRRPVSENHLPSRNGHFWTKKTPVQSKKKRLKIELKTEKLNKKRNSSGTQFLNNFYFWKIAWQLGSQKTQNGNWVCQKSLETTIKIGPKSPWPRYYPYYLHRNVYIHIFCFLTEY